jgi:hypothetical protein
MLQDISLVWVMIPFIIGAVIYSKIGKHRTGDPLRDKLKDMQVMLIMFGVILVVLWFSLPFTASLSTFGYPETVEDINSQKKVLHLFQKYNKAITRTTDALYWLLFTFTFWFVASMYQFMKILMVNRDKELEALHDEKAV